MTDAEPRSTPCMALVFAGMADTGHRCGRPEDDDLHDPLGPRGRHVYDPNPPVDGSHAGCWLCVTMGSDGIAPGWILAPDPAEYPGMEDDWHDREGESVPVIRCACNPAPEPGYRLESRTAGDVTTTHDPAGCDDCWEALITARMVAAFLPPDARARSARAGHQAEWQAHPTPAPA